MITEQVKDNLMEAEGYLRNALHWAAKNERPMVCSTIAEMIGKIESVIHTDEILDKLENRNPRDSGIFDSWFNTDE